MTDRYTTRVPMPSDAAWLHAALNDPATHHALIDLDWPYPLEQVRSLWLHATPDRVAHVVERNGDAVGYIWFGLDPAAHEAEFSMLIAPPHQHQGIGRAALHALWPHIWRELGRRHSVTRCWAHTRPDNAASVAVLRHCGFKHVTTADYPCAHHPAPVRLSRFAYPDAD